jgi:hypothetical protein
MCSNIQCDMVKKKLVETKHPFVLVDRTHVNNWMNMHGYPNIMRYMSLFYKAICFSSSLYLYRLQLGFSSPSQVAHIGAMYTYSSHHPPLHFNFHKKSKAPVLDQELIFDKKKTQEKHHTIFVHAELADLEMSSRWDFIYFVSWRSSFVAWISSLWWTSSVSSFLLH